MKKELKKTIGNLKEARVKNAWKCPLHQTFSLGTMSTITLNIFTSHFESSKIAASAKAILLIIMKNEEKGEKSNE